MNVTIYHNPRCSKSRKTLELLIARGVSATVVEYLETPPDAQTLKSILTMLEREPRDLMRTKEDVYRELDLSNVDLTAEELIDAMVNNPILIERPIVIAGGRAVVGRPPENIAVLFPQ
ncbi:MAG: arsenate reductase (glutaredoxin) [Proteobacteria bacterium]|nr:MAG: arsenate reductase (glutaredoxin) [Pseudomonadota bacterium]